MKTLFTAGLLASSLLATSATTETDKSIESQPTKKMDDMIVTANRVETDANKINRSITVITNEEITQKKAHDLGDLLAQTPGIDVKRTGPKSNITSIYIRGMRGYHTKVLIDGVALQDTTGPQTTPILPSIPLENIERIEIIRGAGSTLYGSNAMGGVINIITKKSEEDRFAAEMDLAVSTHGDQVHSLFANGKEGKFDYSIGLGWIDNHSISSRKNDDEKDAFRNLSLTGQMGYQFNENFKLSLFGTYEDQDSEYDQPIIGDWHIQNSQVGAKLDATNLFDNMLDSSLRYSFTENVRNDRDQPLSYIGKTQEIDWVNTLKINEFNRLIFGLTYTDESARTDTDYGFGATKTSDSYWTQAYFANYEIELIDNLLLDAGLRYNNHSVFGGETTYSASASYYIDATGTRLKTSWGTGYRTPSLSELYNPSIGNPDLQPETSTSWDIGFEQEVTDNLEFGITYFSNRVKDSIAWQWTGPTMWDGAYNQIEGLKFYGVESYINYSPTENLTLNFTHTYQHSNNMESDEADFPYLPDNKFSANINWSATEKLNLNLNGIYVSERPASAFDPVSELNSYTLLNVATSYQVTEALQVYGKVDNILDKDYVESVGYSTHGIVGWLGVKYRF